MTKEEMIQKLPRYGRWRSYVRNWKNDYGNENGLNGHILAIWPDFWKRCYKDSKLSKA